MRGWTLAVQGQEEGIPQISQGVESWQAAGNEAERSHFLALLAEACGTVGRAKEGLSTVAEALAHVHKTGERFYEAELFRLKGELLLQQARQQGRGNGEP
jgi:predicted ATPase